MLPGKLQYTNYAKCIRPFETTKKDEYVLHVVDQLVDRVTWLEVWSVDQVTEQSRSSRQQRRLVVESARSIL